MSSARKALISAAVVGSTLLGGAVGASLVGIAGAADLSTTTANSTSSSPNTAATPAAGDRSAFDPARSGHSANGATEALLTGDNAAKVKAAAVAAVPGATVERVENDAEGSPYEAHIVRPDGTRATVKVGSDFKATGVEEGGPGGPGCRHP